MPKFNHYIGIDYSGGGKHHEPKEGIAVAICSNGTENPFIFKSKHNIDILGAWSRKSLAEWLVKVLQSREKVLIGIDHQFSLPHDFLISNNINNWNMVLNTFSNFCNTSKGIKVNDCTDLQNLIKNQKHLKTIAVSDRPDLYRLTECVSAKSGYTPRSAFYFGPFPVAYSTYTGIPWLSYIRENVPKDKLHFWPFDGWDIRDGKSAIVEVYPALWHGKKEYMDFKEIELKSNDERDAYCVAKWMAENDQNGTLKEYLHMAELSQSDRNLAKLEGWILGVK